MTTDPKFSRRLALLGGASIGGAAVVLAGRSEERLAAGAAALAACLPERPVGEIRRVYEQEGGSSGAAGSGITIQPSGGSEMKLPLSSIRSLAVRQAIVEKSFEVHSLRHCTQIEFLDTGVVIGSNSRVEATAAGYVRLSFAIDGWASDPDGLKAPGPNYKTNLVDGFPFGALVGKVGATGPRFIVGRRLDKNGLGEGRLYLAVNDNGHWQNNIGSFRVKLRVSDAYDVSDPQ